MSHINAIRLALALLWDLNARPNEITLLKIKHIRLKDNYGEGEVLHEAKTGTGPVLLTFFFPYVIQQAALKRRTYDDERKSWPELKNRVISISFLKSSQR